MQKTITIKFDIGDTVFCLDNKHTVRTRLVRGFSVLGLSNGKLGIAYSFIKDSYEDTDYTGELPTIYTRDDFFWIPQDKVFETKEELINSL